jgi:TonB family protein
LDFILVRAVVVLALSCVPFSSVWASASMRQMDRSANDAQSGVQTAPVPLSDFDLKIVQGVFFVRQKGTVEWKRSSKLSEPIAVALVDGDHKLYVPTKAINPPKALHMEDPDYPPSEKKSAKDGQVSLHIVVDDHGLVRFPTVDATPNAEFTSAALEAINKWRFEPAKLNGQPVAVLVIITMAFRHL